MNVTAFELPTQIAEAVNAFQHSGRVLIYRKYSSSVDRSAMRENIRVSVAQLLRLQDHTLDFDIRISNQRGVAPEVSVNGRRIFVSISHSQSLSIAVISDDGPIGVDIVDIREIVNSADLLQTAEVFLSPSVASSLAQLSGDQLIAEFCHEWAKREASLKCVGLPMREWRGEDQNFSRSLIVDSNRLDPFHIFAVASAIST